MHTKKAPHASRRERGRVQRRRTRMSLPEGRRARERMGDEEVERGATLGARLLMAALVAAWLLNGALGS